MHLEHRKLMDKLLHLIVKSVLLKILVHLSYLMTLIAPIGRANFEITEATGPGSISAVSMIERLNITQAYYCIFRK